MKMHGQSLRWLIWATLYCFLHLTRASEEELLDFDFSDLKEIDWNYDTDNNPNVFNRDASTSRENLITFDDDLDLEEDNQVHPFDWREKMLRTALSKALTNKAVRQKFIEVMPILRVLSRQQRLALSALITAQISAKKGHELKLDQVRMMFGDDKNLLLPIVYDIANLVRNSAKKYIEFDYSIADLVNFPKRKVSYVRRTLDLTPEESADDEASAGIGTIPVPAKMTQEDELEDFMASEDDVPSGGYLDPMEINAELGIMKSQNTTIPLTVTAEDDTEEIEDDNESVASDNVVVMADMSDPLKINHELQKDVPTMQLLKGKMPEVVFIKKFAKPVARIITSTTVESPLRRTKRSTENSEFIHKLVRSIPVSVNEADLQRGLGGRTLKLNTTAFATPKETTLVPSSTTAAPGENAKSQDENSESYKLVEDFAFASLNGSEIALNEDDETLKEDEVDAETEHISDTNKEEVLPTPEELIAGPRYRVVGSKVVSKRVHTLGSSKRQRVAAPPPPMPDRSNRPLGSGVPPPTKCERFTASMCIRTEDYPIDLIMGSIRRHRNAMPALLAEHTDPTNSIDNRDEFEEYVLSKKRRQDSNMVQGGLCQSIVRYARPQKARSASGEWKYIVNTGQHTQTLRLEKCTNPQESCSYLSSSYRSHCSQVYNYHRLLSWDKTRGLHVDIFKVPTCCSCHVDGYKQQQFAAALSSSFTKKDFTSSNMGDPYRHSELDYADEDDDDSGFNLHNQQHESGYDANEVFLGSNRVKTKVPSPTVGSYLSPPGSDEFEQYPFKLPKDTSAIIKPSSSLSSSSASLSKTYLRDLARRRPHKSYNDYRTDLDFAPSEQHAEREVKVYGTPNGKTERNPLKTKNIYSVTHTGSSHNSTTALTTSTGTIRAFTPGTVRVPATGRPYADTNAHKKPSETTVVISTEIAYDGTTLPESSVSTTASPVRTASLPAHYYTHAAGGRVKAKQRVRTPYPHTSVTAKATTATASFETTEHIETSSQRPVNPSVNSDVFRNRYKAKFNLTAYYRTTTPMPSSYSSPSSSFTSSSSSVHPPRRINYSYHPIIDFFEYNRRVLTTTTTSTTTQIPPTATSSKTKSSRPTHLLSSTQLYPHKIPNAVSANIYQQPQQKPHQNERRIGYGAAGEGSSVSHPRDINPYVINGRQTNVANTDVWHPMIVQDY